MNKAVIHNSHSTSRKLDFGKNSKNADNSIDGRRLSEKHAKSQKLREESDLVKDKQRFNEYSKLKINKNARYF